MSRTAALGFLNSLLNLERFHKPHSRAWNLKRMRELYEIFGHPERGVFTVVVGGTKGKGSTAYFLSEILRRSGLRVGFYHSPHLEEPRERIWIHGRPLSRKDFEIGLGRIKRRLLKKAVRYTYFEILTLLASLLFKERKMDVAIYEVGMGGRLDATHVLPAKILILTPIHYDHEAYLGSTLAAIAREKAAILLPGRDAVVATQVPEVRQVIRSFARKRRCRLWPPVSQKGIRTRLLGDFQKLNASVALRAAQILRNRYRFPVTEKAQSEGLLSNHWPGRMECLNYKGVSILLDGAHNPKAIEALCRNLKRLFPRRRKILIFGTSRDKRSDRMWTHLKKVFHLCIVTRSNTPRAKEVARLLAEARDHFKVLIPAASSKEALGLAQKFARPADLIVGTGSFYLIGELRSLLR